MIANLAAVASAEAHRGFHGKVMGVPSNLQPIADLFPPAADFSLDSWENCWCAAFVYYCCKKAGVKLPSRYPDARVTASFAACSAWEQWARLPDVGRYRSRYEKPRAGDLVIYDGVFENGAHDHMGVIVAVDEGYIRVAEGNVNNVSLVVTRPLDARIRCFIRMHE